MYVIHTVVYISHYLHLCTYFIGFGTPYSSDLYYGKTFHQVPSDEASIQSEIMTNGPITVMFQVFQDFYNYRSGQ